MLKLLRKLRPAEWLQALVCLGFVVLQVWLDLRLPDYMSDITKKIQTPGIGIGDILPDGGWMVACAFGSLVASIVVGYFAARISASFSRRLRSDIYGKVESFSMEEINRFSTASLITRSTNDINQVQMLIAMGLQVMIKAPITAVWAVLKISGKNWQWSFATAGAVLVLIAMSAFLIIFALPRFRKIQTQTDRLNLVTRENLTGVRVVRAYNAENYQQGKFAEANDDLTHTYLTTTRMMAVLMPGITMIMNGLSLAIYWIGAVLINDAAVPERIGLFADMVVYSSYAMQVIMAFMMMVMIFIMLPRASVSAKRIDEVLSCKPSITDGTLSSQPWAMGEIEFRGVSFRYPGADEYVLRDISFRAEPGETIAFIGSTGSGKSTLVNLVPRFYDASEGEVLVDGVNVKEYRQSDLHNKIGYVSQKAVMFAGSVRSNIAFGDNGKSVPTDGEIESALDIAQAKSFVDSMEHGADSAIAQGGTNVSGGQKQRLSIARAIARKPEIFIFDDSFSALDYRTDRELRSQLARETSGVTTLMVAQRIGTVKDADKIIVLDEGRMAGIGTHRELLESCPVYLEIARSQLSQEELGI